MLDLASLYAGGYLVSQLLRDNQGETAASIRMRFARGWTDGVRAYPSEVRPAPAAHFSPRGQCGLAVVSDWVKYLIRLEIEGSAIARPSHHRPPDEAVHDLPT